MWSFSNMASNMEVFIDGQKCIKVVNADGLDMIDENGNVVFVSESGNLLLVYGKVDNIVYFDKKLAGRLIGLPPVAMTTTVVYHTFAMPFSMQRGRPLKFMVYHRVVLSVKKQHLGLYVYSPLLII